MSTLGLSYPGTEHFSTARGQGFGDYMSSVRLRDTGFGAGSMLNINARLRTVDKN